MKTKPLFLRFARATSIPVSLWIALFLGIGLLRAGNLEVELKDFDAYRDFSIAGQTREATATVFAERLKEFWARQEATEWPEGKTLEIAFLDIDLAGEVEPWRNPLNPDLRVLDRRTPPYLRFHYAVRAPGEEIVVEGEETLFDRRFLFNRLDRNGDELVFPHEFALFYRWVEERLVPRLAEPES